MKKSEITAAIKKGFCTNHTGKMSGMISYSTCAAVNPICAARAKDPESVCAHCFALAMMNRYSALQDKTTRNYEIMAADVYSVSVMPKVNAALFRLESFGDLGNTNQAANYFNLAKANPRTTFALWTKNPHIIEEMMMEHPEISKPKNLIIIYSSPKLNQESAPDYWFIDKVFTVYDKQHAESVSINCGARSCLECGRCYSKRTGRNVNELLK